MTDQPDRFKEVMESARKPVTFTPGETVQKFREAHGIAPPPATAEPSADPTPWQLIPAADIDAMTDDLAGAELKRIVDRYGYKLPHGYDLDGRGAKGWLKDAVRDPAVKAAYDAEQARADKAREEANTPPVVLPGVTGWSRDFVETNANGKVTRLNHAAIGDYIRSKHVIIPFKETNYVYDPATGIFRENAGELEREIIEIALQSGYKGSVNAATAEIMFYAVYSGEPFRDYPFNHCDDFIPCRNGVVKIDFVTGTATLLPHSPEHRITFTLPVDYDPGADPAEIDRIFREWVEPRDLPILLQIPAQSIYQMQTDKTFKRSYVLQGDFNAGKSTYLNFLKEFFGEDNICHVSLQDITGGDRFSSSRLENKILNSYDDLPDQDLNNTGRFKNLTGSTHHSIERKHKPGYDGRIFAVHVFSCNRPPNVPQDALYDPAFWERWIYVVFPYAFPTDPTFEEKHFTDRNKSAFLNMVIGRLIEIRQNKALTVNLEAEEVMDRWTRQADPLCQFIEEKMIRLEKGTADFDKAKLFAEYTKFCEDEKINPKLRLVSLNKFTRGLLNYRITTTRTSAKIGGKKIPYDCYRGPYTWKDETTRDDMKARPPSITDF